jgi:enamine deaminase RidA (YjgF/YER057c/UK114 family)
MRSMIIRSSAGLRACATFALALLATSAMAQSAFTSYPVQGARYSAGATMQSGAPIYFSSGGTAGQEAAGDMKAQATAAMQKLADNLVQAGLSIEDVAFSRAYLAPGADGAIDYAGWNAAWDDFFGKRKQPTKPARTTVGVPLLGKAGTLIEIEFVCFPPRADKIFASSDALKLPVGNPQLKPYGTRENRIYSGMGIVPGTTMYWTAGTVAPVANEKLPPTDREYRGDMKTQARNTLLKIKENLATVGLGFDDVVFMRAFLAPDAAKNNTFDYDGWNAAYEEFFNNKSNPHKPARTTVTTPGFGPGVMLEVEVIAAFPKRPALFDAKDTHPKLRAYGEADAMIASGIAVDAPASLFFSSGAVSTVKGDLKAQAVSALESLQAQLARAGVKFSDVVFLRAYVVPGADGTFDRNAWTAAYTQFFNNKEQPHKPARTTIQVKSLPNPDSTIEVDAIAVAAK